MKSGWFIRDISPAQPSQQNGGKQDGGQARMAYKSGELILEQELLTTERTENTEKSFESRERWAESGDEWQSDEWQSDEKERKER